MNSINILVYEGNMQKTCMQQIKLQKQMSECFCKSPSINAFFLAFSYSLQDNKITSLKIP